MYIINISCIITSLQKSTDVINRLSICVLNLKWLPVKPLAKICKTSYYMFKNQLLRSQILLTACTTEAGVLSPTVTTECDSFQKPIFQIFNTITTARKRSKDRKRHVEHLIYYPNFFYTRVLYSSASMQIEIHVQRSHWILPGIK